MERARFKGTKTMKKILTTLACCLILAQAYPQIIEAPTLTPFEKALENIDSQTLVMFDVDETLIVPKDAISKPCVRGVLNELVKEVLEKEALGEHLYSLMYLKMEFEIVDPQVVQVIKALQSKNIKTIAFTRMNTGRCGAIPSMEDWRLKQLKDHGIDFSPAFPQFEELSIGSEKPSLFKQGVLCANRQDKGPVFMGFLKAIQWKPEKVLFIDNRLDYLESVEASLKHSGIEFLGFHYIEVELRPCLVNKEMAAFQLLHLAQTGEWLSDGEAQKLMQK